MNESDPCRRLEDALLAYYHSHQATSWTCDLCEQAKLALPGKILRTYSIDGDTPRDQAFNMMYQKYLGARDIADLPKEVAVAYIALGFAKYLLNHPTELEAEIKERDRSERAWKEEGEPKWKAKYPDKPLR